MPITLTDTHRVILAAAAARDDGAIFPLPDTLNIAGAARDRMLLGLRDRGFLLETPCPVGATPWRREEDGSAFTLHIADGGLSAIGIEVGENPTLGDARAAQDSDADGSWPSKAVASRRAGNSSLPADGPANTGCKPSKLDAILAQLRQPDGATIPDLMEATGWQAHSVRGFLSGTVRKKLALNLASESIDGRGRVYRVIATETSSESVSA